MTRPIQPTRILIVGGGGREHALAWKLAAEPGVNEVVVGPGSDAIALEPRVRRAANVDPLDPAAVVAVARERAVELAVIGPEAPLAAGVADALAAAGVPVFGPSVAAARLETSKAFCHEIAAAAGVLTARSASFAEEDAGRARAWAREEAEAAGSSGVVVKADGLAGGKGVIVCDAAGDAERAIAELFAVGTGRLVLEERLSGPEASVIAICDGRTLIPLPAARDHKRLLDGDRGPNTGGMGAYSPLPDLTDSDIAGILESVHRPLVEEMARRGHGYRGFLYAGLMLTADGPKLLEINARLGDPEAQVILPQVAGALGPILLAAARGSLGSLAAGGLPALPGASAGIVLAADGYPGSPRRGDRIDGVGRASASGALVFHSGTRRDAEGTWRTDSGRVLTVVGRGSDLGSARAVAERAADEISWSGMQRRHDIALTLPLAEVPA